MGADIVFLIFVLYGFVFGLRRGIYKEIIAFFAIFLAIFACRTWRQPAGQLIHSKLDFIGPSVATVLGAILVWIAVFLVVTIVGRIILRKLRDPDAENNLEKAADGAIDAAEGKEKDEGPVTLLTNPIAKAEKKFIYWTDKLGGGLLGIVKGAVVAYAIFAVVYFVDLHLGGLGGVKDSITRSRAASVYQMFLVDVLRKFPEYRVVENAASMERLVEATKGDPKLIEQLATHKVWTPLKLTQAFKDLAADPDIQAKWTAETNGKRDQLQSLLATRKVRRLLSDAAFHEAFADADIEKAIRWIDKRDSSELETASPPR